MNKTPNETKNVMSLGRRGTGARLTRFWGLHGKWEMDTGTIQGWRNGPIVRQGEILGCDSL